MTQHQNSSDGNCCQNALGGAFAFLLLRLWIGVRTLLAGLEKFAGVRVEQQPLLDEFGDPDISGAMVELKLKEYGFSHYHGLPDALKDKFSKEPLMADWMLDLYAGTLGYLLILLGGALILGALPRLTLFATGLLYTSLTIGLVLINESAGIAWLGTQVAMIAGALILAKYNRFAILNKY